jgi:caffeoyl-CoA O-methyltransferase
MITEPAIEAYAEAHSSAPPAGLEEVAATTRELLRRRAAMMVGPLEGAFLAALAGLSGARTILEIGTFTGYSALAMATGLGEGGRIITCELDDEHASLARRHFAAHDPTGRIDLRVGPALATIEGLDGPFDMVFIDADKAGYDAYFEAVLPKLSATGCIVFDNVLWGGQVLPDAAADDPDTLALRALNAKLAHDPRITTVMLPIRDGVTIVRRRV